MDKVKVSLCLITFNQPDSVACFLESISAYKYGSIEVLIRDDSTNDETFDTVDSYKSSCSVPIHYFRGKKSSSGGYDNALLFLTERAQGEYIWWYGDDVLVEDAISRVLSVLDGPQKFALVWINARNIDDSSDRGLDLGGDKIFEAPGAIFETNVGLLGFPSATIIRRDLISEKIKEAQKFIGTTLTGFYLVMSAITTPGAKSIYIQEPCLLSKPKPTGEVRWYDSFQVHGINYARISLDFRNAIDRKSYRKGIAEHFGRIWRAVLYERALGLETGFASRTPKLIKMAKLYWGYPEFYVAFFLMLLPRPVLGGLFKAFRKLRNR